MKSMFKSLVLTCSVLCCVAFQSQSFAQEIITVDEQEAEFDGSWQLITEKRGYANGTSFRYAMLKQVSSPTATATFRPMIPRAGLYHVEVYSSPGRNRWQIPCTISGSQGEIKVVADQTKGPGGWHRVAENIPFAAGNRGFVKLANNKDKLESNDKIVMADAVRFIRSADEATGVGDIMEATEATFDGTWSRHNAQGGWARTNYTFASTSIKNAMATYQPTLPKDGLYDVYVWCGQGGRSVDATWQISGKRGNVTVLVDQQKSADDWFQIGSGIEFGAGKSGFVRLSNQAGNGAVVADAVAFVYIGTP